MRLFVKRAILFAAIIAMLFQLSAESLDYIGFTTGFDIGAKSTKFDNGNEWRTKRSSVDLALDLLVYFNNEHQSLRSGAGFAIGCGFPFYYETVFGVVDGAKPLTIRGKATFELAYLIDHTLALESRAGISIRVNYLDFHKNYKEVGLSAPTNIMNAELQGVFGISARYEVMSGIVLRAGMDFNVSFLEYLETLYGPDILSDYMGARKGNRLSLFPYASVLFSY